MPEIAGRFLTDFITGERILGVSKPAVAVFEKNSQRASYIIEVFANNTTLSMLTFLAYLSILCFNLGGIVTLFEVFANNTKLTMLTYLTYSKTAVYVFQFGRDYQSLIGHIIFLICNY